MCSAASFLVSGDTLGSFVYVPCEVIKQRMQIQGTSSSWSSFISRNSVPVKPRGDMYGYYTGMFQAGCSIWKEQGPKGLYAGYVTFAQAIIVNWINHPDCRLVSRDPCYYFPFSSGRYWSTLARDVPFAGLMVWLCHYVIWHFCKTVTSVHLRVFVSSWSLCFSISGSVLRSIKGSNRSGKEKVSTIWSQQFDRGSSIGRISWWYVRMRSVVKNTFLIAHPT